MVFSSTGISLGAYVAMDSNSINGLANLTAPGTIPSETASTNTLTTSGDGTTIKSEIVLYRGLDNSINMDAHPSGVLCLAGFYTDGLIKNRSGLSIGDQTAIDT